MTPGSGLGKACALAYAKEGVAGLVCADIELSAAEVVAQEARRTAVHTKFRAIALYVDVTQEASVDQAIQTIMQHFGRMDYAVNCAGVSHLLLVTRVKPTRLQRSGSATTLR